jgi:hypothetical protein
LKVTSELQAIEERAKTAAAYTAHPALLRLEELAALQELGRNANARIYLDFLEPTVGLRAQLRQSFLARRAPGANFEGFLAAGAVAVPGDAFDQDRYLHGNASDWFAQVQTILPRDFQVPSSAVSSPAAGNSR